MLLPKVVIWHTFSFTPTANSMIQSDFCSIPVTHSVVVFTEPKEQRIVVLETTICILLQSFTPDHMQGFITLSKLCVSILNTDVACPWFFSNANNRFVMVNKLPAILCLKILFNTHQHTHIWHYLLLFHILTGPNVTRLLYRSGQYLFLGAY